MSEMNKLLDDLERDLEGLQPYPGLRPFLPDESRFFKGRATQVHEIGQRLAVESCVSILGGSGCGKSSIVMAGVVPALRRKLIPGRGDLWRIATFTPGRAPIGNLVKALAVTLYNTVADDGSVEARKEGIKEVLFGPDRLGGVLPIFRKKLKTEAGVSEQAIGNANFFIIVDQFEELFRDENKGKAQTARLVELIIDFWKRRSAYPGLYLALTMRTDDLHRCAEFIELPDFINSTSYLTRRLKEDELREAIIAPVRPSMFRVGLLKSEDNFSPGHIDLRPYDAEVVTELLDATAEISHHPDHLPLLQHFLAILWRFTVTRWRTEATNRGATVVPRITRDDLASVVGFADWSTLQKEQDTSEWGQNNGFLLRQCLNYVADELYAGNLFGTPLTPGQQEVTRTAFCLMGEVDDRGSVKRRWTTRKEIARVAGLKVPDQNIETFVRRFSRDYCLLWVRNSGVMDVSHEALMRNWNQLDGWLREDRDARAAYSKLGEQYEKWKKSHRGRFSRLLSWFRRNNGYLGSDTLDFIAPLLTRKYRKFGIQHITISYNQYWSERFELTVRSDDREHVTQENDKFNHSLDFLRQSMRRDSIFRKLLIIIPPLAVFSVLIIFYHQLQKEYDQQSKLMASQYYIMASQYWDGLETSTISTGADVRIFWNIAEAEPGLKTEFIKQLPDSDNMRKLSFNPQPIIRAIGLFWPQKAREEISKKITEELLERKEVTGIKRDEQRKMFTEANLACGIAMLRNRFDQDCQDTAQKHFEDYLKNITSVRELWSKGRTLACLSAWIDPQIKNSVVDKIFNILQNAEVEKASAWEILGYASSVTAAASVLENDSRFTPEKESEIMGKIANSIIASFKNDSDSFMMPRKARSLVSLIVVLPPGKQRDALDHLLSFVSERTDALDSDILLILAQAYEIVAELHQKENMTDQFQSLVEKAAKLLEPIEALEQDNTSKNTRSYKQRSLARLTIPLVEVMTSSSSGAMRETFLRMAGIEVKQDGDVDYRLALPEKDQDIKPEDSLLIGLRARLLAFDVVTGHFNQNREKMLKSLDGLLAGKPDEKSEVQAKDHSGDNDSWALTNFEREALARAIGALALDSGLEESQRETTLLKTAKIALANTGSAEEAAALARAITNLLKTKDDVELVEEVVELLKYPTSGLTAREPNAKRPYNATDIFMQALRERPTVKSLLETEDNRVGPVYYLELLEQITKSDTFKDIDLKAPVKDPRQEDSSGKG